MTEATQTAKPIPTHIVIVLDRSGSMEPIASDVIGGYNRFLAEQKALPGKARLTLVLFDSEGYDIVQPAVRVDQGLALTPEVYFGRGMTPLLDAEGRTIAAVEAREADRRQRDKPAERVLFVTWTDGLENASREWSLAKLTEAKKAAEARGWTFLYLGVGHDAYGQSMSVGTYAANTTSRPATARGVHDSFAGGQSVASSYRVAAYAGDTATLDASVTDAYDAFGVDKDDDATEDAPFGVEGGQTPS